MSWTGGVVANQRIKPRAIKSQCPRAVLQCECQNAGRVVSVLRDYMLERSWKRLLPL